MNTKRTYIAQTFWTLNELKASIIRAIEFVTHVATNWPIILLIAHASWMMRFATENAVLFRL
jgi:hypothetical protein